MLGVLSNCHAREVRAWSSSPLAQHVTVWDAIFVGNGSSDEQDRRAAQADVSAATVDQLGEVLLGATRTPGW